MDSINERYKKISKALGLKSTKEFALSVGSTVNTFGTWSKKGRITPEGILKILDKYPQVSKTYLETGTGDVLKLDTGVSNYAHDARTQEVCDAYVKMSNEDKEIFYNIAKRFRTKGDAVSNKEVDI